MHRWDAEHAAGRSVALDVPAAVDSIEEFLTFSVATPENPFDEPLADLAGEFVLQATDADAGWTISDGSGPGTVRFDRGGRPGLPVIAGTASDLLLWLYRRVELPVPAAAAELVNRFRTLTFTD